MATYIGLADATGKPRELVEKLVRSEFTGQKPFVTAADAYMRINIRLNQNPKATAHFIAVDLLPDERFRFHLLWKGQLYLIEVPYDELRCITPP